MSEAPIEVTSRLGALRAALRQAGRWSEEALSSQPGGWLWHEDVDAPVFVYGPDTGLPSCTSSTPGRR